jgi:quercetin dioxygenase-like cupin family protein
MKANHRRTGVAVAVALSALLIGITVYASVSQVIAVGTMEHSELVGGPATVTMRTLTIDPTEVLGWHHHPGVGAYTIVKTGVLTIEDGCGGEVVYTSGQAFLEPPGRVHRGKNLTTESVVTAQMFLVPTGSPTSVTSMQLCGPPAVKEDCREDGWMIFNHPRRFRNQGDCEQYALTGR